MAAPKHPHVPETLTTGERLAPFAILAEAELEPIAKPTRCALDWDGDRWVETDPETGAEIARGTLERRPQ